MPDETRVPIHSDGDVVMARQRGRMLAMELGFQGSDLAVIATAISELARNIVSYAGSGEILLGPVEDGLRRGIRVVARDEGPGITNLEAALLDGYSTGGGLGIGLPGARRLMDEFDITTQPGQGTQVTLKKWRR